MAALRAVLCGKSRGEYYCLDLTQPPESTGLGLAPSSTMIVNSGSRRPADQLPTGLNAFQRARLSDSRRALRRKMNAKRQTKDLDEQSLTLQFGHAPLDLFGVAMYMVAKTFSSEYDDANVRFTCLATSDSPSSLDVAGLDFRAWVSAVSAAGGSLRELQHHLSAVDSAVEGDSTEDSAEGSDAAGASVVEAFATATSPSLRMANFGWRQYTYDEQLCRCTHGRGRGARNTGNVAAAVVDAACLFGTFEGDADAAW